MFFLEGNSDKLMLTGSYLGKEMIKYWKWKRFNYLNNKRQTVSDVPFDKLEEWEVRRVLEEGISDDHDENPWKQMNAEQVFNSSYLIITLLKSTSWPKIFFLSHPILSLTFLKD